MPKHRARRVSTPQWSVLLGTLALLIGSGSLLVTNSAASAHCNPAWSHCEHHPSTTPGGATETTAATETSPTTDIEIPVDPESPTSTPTAPVRPPIPTYDPPTGGAATSTSPGNNSQRTATRPPGQLPKQNTPTAPEGRDAGLVPVAPTGGGPGGGGGTNGGGIAIESVPTVEPATSAPAPTAATRQSSPLQNQVDATAAPVSTATDPVPPSAQCLLGTTDSGGCAGADTARDLAPGGLLVLGALALLGSGSFLESLRGTLRS